MAQYQTVQIRNLIIGEGLPKICVSIMGETREELKSQAEAFQTHRADIAEWRADSFLKQYDLEKVTYEELKNIILPILQMLRLELRKLPLLFTFRTLQEGGEAAVTRGIYQSINQIAVESYCIDLLDIQYLMGEKMCGYFVSMAHEAEMAVILSYHDFEKTPSEEEMLDKLEKMQMFGADIAKIAVMPENLQDVLHLLSVTNQFAEQGKCPVITMSMGKKGMISRVTGEIFGSALTFAAGKKASAPGQIAVSNVREALRLLHENS